MTARTPGQVLHDYRAGASPGDSSMWDDLPQEERDRYEREAGAVLAAFPAVPCAECGQPSAPGYLCRECAVTISARVRMRDTAALWLATTAARLATPRLGEVLRRPLILAYVAEADHGAGGADKGER